MTNVTFEKDGMRISFGYEFNRGCWYSPEIGNVPGQNLDKFALVMFQKAHAYFREREETKLNHYMVTMVHYGDGVPSMNMFSYSGKSELDAIKRRLRDYGFGFNEIDFSQLEDLRDFLSKDGIAVEAKIIR